MGRLLSFIAAAAIVILAVSVDTVRAFQCYCNRYYLSSCGDGQIITCPGEGGACEVSIQYDPNFGNYTYQGCVEDLFGLLSCSNKLFENPGSTTPYSYCCQQERCNSKEELQRLIAGDQPPPTDASLSYHYEGSTSGFEPTGTSQDVTLPTASQPHSAATGLASGGESSIHYQATTSDVNDLETATPMSVPTSTPVTANPITTVTSEQPTEGESGLSCICSAGFNQGCVGSPQCTLFAFSSHCIIEVQFPTMEIIFQGCSDLLVGFIACNGEVEKTDTGDGRLVMCCTSDNCNTIDAILSQLSVEEVSTSSVASSTVVLPSSSSVHDVKSGTMISSVPTSTLNTSEGSLTSPPDYVIALIAVLACILLVFIVIIIVVTLLHFVPRHVVGIAIPTESDGTPTISTESVDFSNDHLQDMIGTTSGSGSGMPLLIQRSIATQVTLEHLIGKGKFGEVWKGGYKGDDIAVKIFHTREEASWFHEVDIYSTCLIRHPNIVRFVAADNKDIGMATQLWLITEYCSNGSLYELLLVEALDEATMLKLLHTAASGIAHLHQEITGTEGKPAIAHRDIKSRNILVKADYTCCIADLGLAIRYNKNTDTVEEPPTKRVGTRRYLSPEILNDTINVHNFDCFKRSDIYSFGLVMWETARRGECSGHVEEYQLPYFDLVPSDPSFEDMKKVVVDDVRRPGIPNKWHQSELFHGLSKIIEQCWHHNGEARVTALRVKKNLHNLHSLLGKNKMSSMTKLDDSSLSKINVTPSSK